MAPDYKDCYQPTPGTTYFSIIRYPPRPTSVRNNWRNRQEKVYLSKKAAKQHKKHLRKIKTKKQLRAIKKACKGKPKNVYS